MGKVVKSGHYSYVEKKLLLEAFLQGEAYRDVDAAEFCRITKTKYTTFLGWGNRIGWDGSRMEELRDRRKRKWRKEKSGGIGAENEGKILKIKEKHPKWGPLKIKQYLWRHEQILLPQTSIYKLLKKNGLVTAREQSERAAHNKGFEYEAPLSGVQMDLMHVTLTSGESIYLVTMLDDYSRFVLNSRFIAVKTMNEVMDVFKETVRRYGVMDHLLTDCGSEFVSWQRFTRFEEMLSDLDVCYIASGPDKKENQGKVERWHQTVREELRLRGPMDGGGEAQLWIREVVDMYNFERPHQGIGGLLPADRFFGMREEIEAELERYRASQGRRLEQQIYMVCRIGERKLVVSGARADGVRMRLDGKALGTEEWKALEEFQLEKKSVSEYAPVAGKQGGE